MKKSMLFGCLFVATNCFALPISQEISQITTEIGRLYQSADTLPQQQMDQLFESVKVRGEFLTNVLTEDRYIVINRSSFTFHLYENGTELMHKKVVVGRNSRQTPLFSDTITHIVLNPFWNVPPSLAKWDVIPKIKKDNSVVEKQGYQFIDLNTNAIIPFSVDVLQNNRLRIRQKPSKYNSLGQVKFMFPTNPNRNIFIHDTNAKYLFNRVIREFSSGCVRLEQPLELASYLLDVPADVLQRRITKATTEQWVKLSKPIKVYIVDWDVWVDETNTIRYSK